MRLLNMIETINASKTVITKPVARRQRAIYVLSSLWLGLGLTIVASGCSKKVEPADPLLVPGTAMVTTEGSVAAEAERLALLLAENPAANLVARIDHSKNALTADLTLADSQLLIFGSPELGTKLMQANQAVGLDLPQKILITHASGQTTRLRWNSAEYLRTRHNLSGMDETLKTIDARLNKLASNGSSSTKRYPSNVGINKSGKRSGIVSKLSDVDFATTVAQLRRGLTANEALTIIAEVDHQANARAADMELLPTLLFIVGNPAAGTPLMQSAVSAGLDLPQKILVYQNDDDRVRVAYNQPLYIAERHGITNQKKRLKKIALMLGNITTEATDSLPTPAVNDRIPVPRIRQRNEPDTFL